jgi:TolA-binding protein
MVDFERSAAPAPGDERLLERAAKLALAGARGRHVHPLRTAAAAAIILLIAGAASGAILLRVRRPDSSVEHSDPPRAARTQARRSAASPAIQSVAAPAAEASAAAIPAPVPPAPAAEAPRAAAAGPKAIKRAPGHLVAAAAAAAAQTAEDAGALFARAVSEREQGQTFAALATFRSLQSRFPGSPQAVLSLVSLADLALDIGDAALALGACERYLAIAPSGTLVPEALVGRARALSSLGRAAEADAAWREIARRFPGSPYVRGSAPPRSDTP